MRNICDDLKLWVKREWVIVIIVSLVCLDLLVNEVKLVELGDDVIGGIIWIEFIIFFEEIKEIVEEEEGIERENGGERRWLIVGICWGRCGCWKCVVIVGDGGGMLEWVVGNNSVCIVFLEVDGEKKKYWNIFCREDFDFWVFCLVVGFILVGFVGSWIFWGWSNYDEFLMGWCCFYKMDDMEGCYWVYDKEWVFSLMDFKLVLIVYNWVF